MKSALVTGAAKRIGSAMTRALAEDGYHVFIHYNRSREEAQALADDIRAGGGAATPIKADLGDPASVEGLVAACVGGDRGPLTVLVNNASLFEYDDAASLTVESWNRHSTINLLAPALLTRDFAAALPDGEDGCVINMLDNKVFGLNPDFFSYTVSKVGLHGLTRMQAIAHAPRVRVCGIAPGVTLISGAQTEGGFKRSQELNPLGRGCSPEQIVGAMRFILRTSAMTGQVIAIDGGQSLIPSSRDVYFLTDDRQG